MKPGLTTRSRARAEAGEPRGEGSASLNLMLGRDLLEILFTHLLEVDERSCGSLAGACKWHWQVQ